MTWIHEQRLVFPERIMNVVGNFSHIAILFFDYPFPVCVDLCKTPVFRPFFPHLLCAPRGIALCSASWRRNLLVSGYKSSAGKEDGSTDPLVNHK
jgi:hypothetical protein